MLGLWSWEGKAKGMSLIFVIHWSNAKVGVFFGGDQGGGKRWNKIHHGEIPILRG